MTTKRLCLWFGLVLLFALYSRWHTERSRNQRCDLDGNRIEAWARVDLMDAGRLLKSFCCLTCAEQWPDVPEGAYWQVHDEITGEPLDATRARFVRSSKITVVARACRIHVFRDWQDAVAHARRYEGRLIPNPLDTPRSAPREKSE